jgi:hypothetical protein
MATFGTAPIANRQALHSDYYSTTKKTATPLNQSRTPVASGNADVLHRLSSPELSASGLAIVYLRMQSLVTRTHATRVSEHYEVAWRADCNARGALLRHGAALSSTGFLRPLPPEKKFCKTGFQGRPRPKTPLRIAALLPVIRKSAHGWTRQRAPRQV